MSRIVMKAKVTRKWCITFAVSEIRVFFLKGQNLKRTPDPPFLYYNLLRFREYCVHTG